MDTRSFQFLIDVALGMIAAPNVFISYSWADPTVQEWVSNLADQLRADGVNVWLDQSQLRPGAQLPKFMETAVREADFVVAVCTPDYKKASDGRIGGVGYEGTILSAELLTYGNEAKFIPVLRQGQWPEAAPSWALGMWYIDLRDEPTVPDGYGLLVRTLFGRFSGSRYFGESPRVVVPNRREKTSQLRGPAPTVIAHFLDHYVLELSGYGLGNTYLNRKIGAEANLAFRLSLLASRQVLVPAVSYFQSPLCRRIVERYRPLFDIGAVRLIADANQWDEFKENRLREYAVDTRQHQIYSAINPLRNTFPALVGAEQNTTIALHDAWNELVVPNGEEDLDPRRRVGEAVALKGKPAETIARIPELLGDQAFVAEYIYDHLFIGRNSLILSSLSSQICTLFFGVLNEPLSAGFVDDLIYIRSIVPSNATHSLSYAAAIRYLKINEELLAEVAGCRPVELLSLQDDGQVKQLLQTVSRALTLG